MTSYQRASKFVATNSVAFAFMGIFVLLGIIEVVAGYTNSSNVITIGVSFLLGFFNLLYLGDVAYIALLSISGFIIGKIVHFIVEARTLETVTCSHLLPPKHYLFLFNV